MCRSHAFTRAATGWALLAVALAAGCTKKITIHQIPPFYDGSVKAVAVTPFRNQTGYRGAGNIVSDRLAAMLMANGTYEVLNRNDLRALSDERDLQLDLGKDPRKVEALFGSLADVQAILTGVVSTYSGTSRSERRREPIQHYDARTKRWYTTGYRSYVHTRNEANVVVTAALLGRDGSTIYATALPAQAQRASEGHPPKHDVHALLADATTRAARQLLEQFAIITKEIKIDPTKALRTASELFEGKWTYTDRFSPKADQIIVVLQLPASCDRNRFELRIVRKGQREYVAVKKIVWDGSKRSTGYAFNPKEIVAKGGGPGTYTVKFFAGPEPAFTRDFRIQ